MRRFLQVAAGNTGTLAMIAALAALSIGCGGDRRPEKTPPAQAGEGPAEKAPAPDDDAKPDSRQNKAGPRVSAKADQKADKPTATDSQAVPGPADMAAKPEIRVEQPQAARNPGQVQAAEPVSATTAPAAQTAAAGQAPAPGASNPADSPQPVPKPDPSRPPLPDPRLLLTMTDVAAIAPARARFQRAPLAGAPRTEDSDAILYRPEKGNGFGFSLQIFRSRNALETRKRFDSLLASYPSAQEIASVSGKTFFSYWGDTIHIGFVQPSRNLTAIVSCGRDFCDSDKLMELSTKIAERLR
ncbi:MAG TPA: hypothetical protein PKH54_00410 [Myxococcota bacterium]|nr:hypothetical protein [Myxococcota bacterium]HOA13175.1 hypothetical protein [Myxococcota bacterium]HOC98376.1 hypothetical protein [Myxococcota bacterium]HOH76298.1 hypothetical protein [Myxococcota bacterium]HPV02959.1 hypothetical protein [Myxococcota bacterium]